MRIRFRRVPPILLSIALGLLPACGKRSDPLPPYVKTPLVPSGLEVSQVGNEIEIRVTAPRTTTENRPLPVIVLEWFEAPLLGEFSKVAVPFLQEEVAPGELRVKRFPRPLTEVRFSVRASDGKAKSATAVPAPYKPAPVPEPPTGLQATNTPTGLELRWTNPPGAEPWPSATPTPSPNPFALVPGMVRPPNSAPPSGTPAPPATASPSPSPSAPAPPVALPSPSAPPSPSPGNPPSQAAPPVAPGAVPAPGLAPVVPTPTPELPTAIRIFRTDGLLRLAREPMQASSWIDTTLKPGEKPCYSLRYASSLKPLVESAPTEAVCLETRDVVPPEAPGRLLADLGPNFVELSWAASPALDVAFYRIYRTRDTEPRAMVLETQGAVLRVRDPNTASGPRSYDVVAVDKGGNESPPGPVVKIVIP